MTAFPIQIFFYQSWKFSEFNMWIQNGRYKIKNLTIETFSSKTWRKKHNFSFFLVKKALASKAIKIESEIFM